MPRISDICSYFISSIIFHIEHHPFVFSGSEATAFLSFRPARLRQSTRRPRSGSQDGFPSSSRLRFRRLRSRARNVMLSLRAICIAMSTAWLPPGNSLCFWPGFEKCVLKHIRRIVVALHHAADLPYNGSEYSRITSLNAWRQLSGCRKRSINRDSPVGSLGSQQT